MLPVFVGFDKNEPVAYHVFCHSVFTHTKDPVMFIPVQGEQRDGTNEFIYARFLVPYMMRWAGWAIWADGDMLCRTDIAKLWALRDSNYDVQLVKHDYKTKYPKKYRGQLNVDYPRKNWSSLMLINCMASSWRKITPDYVRKSTGVHLHRFAFIEDTRIGALPKEWNHLVSEYDYDPNAKIAHFTIGIPPYYPQCQYSSEWWNEWERMLHVTP